MKQLWKGVILLLLAILLIVGYNYLKDPQHFPVKVVDVKGKLTYVSQETMQALIEPYVSRSLWAVDINGLRNALKENPWVQDAQVKRIWPDTVSVVLKEQHPIAYWEQDAMVNEEGGIFKPEPLPTLDLPHWEGPRDQLSQVYAMNEALDKALTPVNVHIAVLTLNARWAWQAILSSGLRMELGSQDVAQRLARFVKASPFDVQVPDNIKYVDLRYTNGFVVNSNREQ